MPAVASVMNLNMSRYVETLKRRDRLSAALGRFLADYDAWLCPVAIVPAFRHCRPGPPGEPIEIDGRPAPYYTVTASFVVPFSLTGNPVVVVPIDLSQEGLPIGVQIVGRRWEEMALLNVAEAVTEITGPVHRPPGS